MVPKAFAKCREPANAGNDDDLYVEAIVLDRVETTGCPGYPNTAVAPGHLSKIDSQTR